MSKVSVLDTQKNVLEPCHPAVARRLLRTGQAAILKRYPFTIILKREVAHPNTSDYTLSIDPGSKCTGLAITDSDNNIIAAFELNHRTNVKKGLSNKSGYRRMRRNRKCRYRPARWHNRSRQAPILTDIGWEYKKVKSVDNTKWQPSQKGWVPPSLMSKVYNIHTWVNRLIKLYPINRIAVEHVKFDTQKMANPEIEGVEYQQGTLHGYEAKQYLLEKYKHKCFYCNAKNVPLEVEHISPKGKGGTDRIDNLTISCVPCNVEKSNKLPHELPAAMQQKVEKAIKSAKRPMKDAASVNSIRWKIVETLQSTGLDVVYGTGGRTKYHRSKSNLPKTHYYDAASVTCIPKASDNMKVLSIQAVGYGNREGLGNQVSSGSGKGYPGFRKPKLKLSRCQGFDKFDAVKLVRKSDVLIGSINCFDTTPEGKPQKMRIVSAQSAAKDNRTNCNINQISLIQKRDGYIYDYKPG